MIIDIGTNAPLCPQSTNFPIAEPHMLRNRVLDAFYNAADKNADGDMTEPLERAYDAAAYGRVSDRMNLFTTEAVGFVRGGRYVIAEAWWFKCPVCGFILPASTREES